MRATTSRALLALTLAAGFNAATCTAYAADAPAAAASQPANAVSAAFAPLFAQAQELLKSGNGPATLAKLKELGTLPNLTPYEKYLIVRVRGPAEYVSNDLAAASADFDTLLAGDLLPASERLTILKASASVLYTSEQYPKAAVAIQRYLDAGGDDAQLRELLPQTLYIAKDYAAAAKGFRAQVDAAYAAGRTPTEKTLRLLASSYVESKDDVSYNWTLDRLAVGYPKADYWDKEIATAAHTEKFSERLLVDKYRLRMQVLGAINDDDRLSYAAMAAHAGYPEEAKIVLDNAFATKPFTGADLKEANALRADVNKSAASDRAQRAANESAARSAKDGNALVSLGVLETVGGNAQQGAQMIADGIAKGGIRSPEEAALHLGYAQIKAGHDADAVKTLQAIKSGPNGLVPLAHVWILYAQSRLQAAAAPAAPAASK